MEIINELEKKLRIKRAVISPEMYHKEFRVGRKDLKSARKSYSDGNYKWAIIQSYYSIFHAVRALLYKSGFREESHTALKFAFKALYVEKKIISIETYNTLERGMNLREMADYKESYSQAGADLLIKAVETAFLEIEKELF
ncbi:HEPN domain-containing protein [Candidatus Nomurabacteria bacterium]|nr:HEPN domain-containing protein [Candidatus Nomurabacteria bacterium]